MARTKKRDEPAQAETLIGRWAEDFCARQMIEATHVIEKAIRTDFLAKDKRAGFQSEAFTTVLDIIARLHSEADFGVEIARRWSKLLDAILDKATACEDRAQRGEPIEPILRELRSCAADVRALRQTVTDIRRKNEREGLRAESGPKHGSPCGAENGFNILLLGDLHLGHEGDEARWGNIREKFQRDLRYVETALSGPWDLVIVLGDLTFSGGKDQFRQVEALLDSLWEDWRSKGWCPSLVAVPGNHDLERPDQDDPAFLALRGASREGRLRQLLSSKTKAEEYKQAIGARFRHYDDWWQREPRKPGNLLSGTTVPGEFVVTLPKNGKCLGVMGLNSAFLHVADVEQAKSWLCVTEEQFHGLGGVQWCNRHDACLLLTHHPPDWLTSENRQHFGESIFSPGRFLFHACGHCHVPAAASSSLRAAISKHTLVNAALCGSERLASGEERIHGYLAASVWCEEDRWHFKLWPRKSYRHLDWKFQADSDFDLPDDRSTRALAADL